MTTPARTWPPRLSAGARVALVAPAGPLRGEEELRRAEDNARSFGWQPVAGEHALARNGYFAGSDADRARDVNRALSDDSIDAIWCLRGGYGALRLLPHLDYAALRRRPKPILGFSDVTALHAAVAARCGLVSFHAPTARGVLSDFSRDSLERAIIRGVDSCGNAPESRVLREGRAEGVLAGGNLALVASLVGTPFALSLDGAILVLEDVNEAVYRIDRMLAQLRLADALHGCRAIVFGACTSCTEESDDGARGLDDVLTELANDLGIPCLAGAPVGHIAEQWTLPLGAIAELDTETRRLSVKVSARE